MEKACNSLYALISGQAPRVRQDFGIRNAALDQIIPPHAGLGELPISAAAAGGDDQGRKPMLLEVEGMLEAGFKNRGRRAVILCRSKDYDRIGGPGFVSDGLLPDG
jgi:hypothetical protein